MSLKRVIRRTVAPGAMALVVAACGGELGAPGGSSDDGEARPAGQSLPATPLSTQSASSSIDATAVKPSDELLAEGCIDADETLCAIELALVQQVNELRAGEGLSPLAYDKRLALVARQWSMAQGDAGRLSHDGFPEKRTAVFTERFTGEAPPWISAENCIMSYVRPGTAPELIAAYLIATWKESADHLANMLGPNASSGIGVFVRGKAIYATQIFARPRP